MEEQRPRSVASVEEWEPRDVAMFFFQKAMVGLSERRVYLLNGHEKWGK